MIRLNCIRELALCCFICLGVSVVADQQPYCIELKIDATRIQDHLLESEMEMSVSPGEQYLWYPNWLPGVAGATDQITNLVGLVFYGEKGDVLKWRRDATHSNLFRVNIPEGNSRLKIRFKYIANHPKRLSSAVDSYGTEDLLIVNFNTCLLYPDGCSSSDLPIDAKITLPAGWSSGCSIPHTTTEEGVCDFDQVSMKQLIDSPLVAGKNCRKVTFTSEDAPKTHFYLFGEEKIDIEMSSKRKKQLSRIVPTAVRLFADAPFNEYSFLVVCSNELPLVGLEHQDSSLNIVRKSAMRDDSLFRYRTAYLLSHELTHAWCGKHCLPEGMNSENYHTPLDTELLWVYEGLTQYLMQIIAVRSGLIELEDHLGYMAFRMAEQSRRIGRDWRPLVDTAIAANTLRGYSPKWKDLRRSQDYYDEGALFWMQVDCLLRSESNNSTTLDHFCQKLFYIDEENPSPRSYQLSEVVQILEELSPGSWLRLINRRIYQPIDTLTLDALMLAGYRLGTDSQPSRYQVTGSEIKDVVDTLNSIGMSTDKNGNVVRVIPGSAAEKANIKSTTRIIAINRRQFSDDLLKNAVQKSTNKEVIEFIIQDDEEFSLHEVKYDKGARYPALHRLNKQPDRLKDIFSAKSDANTAVSKKVNKIVK